MISLLLSEGILRRVEDASPCSSCPLRRLCSSAGTSVRLPSLYLLTGKGRRLCREVS
ncbi:MAG: hypothetical protein J7J20_01200 [Desulfurococcales archaeon]|nr:hypothetical protein [Desulfurococcales archaeon]